MKNLDFIFIGTAKNSSYKTLESEYFKKICHYTDSQIHTIKDAREGPVEVRKQKETAEILKKLKPGDAVVICDEHGKNLDSILFSKKIASWQSSAKRIVFIIGGAYGLDLAKFSAASFVLKLSDFTLPHELARTVLLEQVYRGLTILAGEKYHHE